VDFLLFGARCCSAAGLGIGPFAVAVHRFTFSCRVSKVLKAARKDRKHVPNHLCRCVDRGTFVQEEHLFNTLEILRTVTYSEILRRTVL
jgi:hypothetical protein